MDFLKKHYEKVLLGVVLLGSLVAVAFLPFKINSEKQKLVDLNTQLRKPKAQPLTNLDLTLPEKSLKRAAVPVLVMFDPPNKLFNPMPWQQTKDTPPRLIPGTKTGPGAATVTNIVPQYLILSFDSVSLSEVRTNYVVGVEKQAAPNARDRAKKPVYVRPGDKSDIFRLLSVNGPPDSPTNLVVELNDTGDKVTIAKDAPYKRVDGYTAELRYAPENRTWPPKRVTDKVSFNGEDYKIVAITSNEVVLLAPNQKKWPITNTVASK